MSVENIDSFCGLNLFVVIRECFDVLESFSFCKNQSNAPMPAETIVPDRCRHVQAGEAGTSSDSFAAGICLNLKSLFTTSEMKQIWWRGVVVPEIKTRQVSKHPSTEDTSLANFVLENANSNKSDSNGYIFFSLL